MKSLGFVLFTIATAMIAINNFASISASADPTAAEETDFLSSILRVREQRLKRLFLIMKDRKKVAEHLAAGKILSSMTPNFGLLLKAGGLFALEDHAFHGKALNFRRESVQLIRDLDAALTWETGSSDPCFKYVLDDVENRHGVVLSDVVLNIGWCYKLTLVDGEGNRILRTLDEIRTSPSYTVRSGENIGQFEKLEESKLPNTDRVRGTLNGILRLFSNIDKDDEFMSNKSQWYGAVTEDNYKKWQRLSNSALLCRPHPQATILEDDDSEAAALIEERQIRQATYPYRYLDGRGKRKLIVNNDVLNDIVADTEQEELKSLSYNSSEVSIDQLKNQLAQLSRDYDMEIALVTSKKLPDSLKDECTRDFIEVYSHWPKENLPRIERGSFSDDTLRNFILARFVLRVPYVDSEGNIMELPDSVTTGKYIWFRPFDECPISTRLRHIVNGYERVYNSFLKTDFIKTLGEPPRKIRKVIPPSERLIQCKYYPVSEFIEDDVSQDDIEQEQNRTNKLGAELLGEQYELLDSLAGTAINSSEPIVTLPKDELKKFPLFAEAHDVFSTWPIHLRADAYRCIKALCIEQRNSTVRNTVLVDLIGSETKQEDTCKVHSNCPDRLLRLLQIVGQQFGLKYIDEIGSEVPIDDTLSGVFVFVPLARSEEEPTRIARHQLNALLKLMKEAIKG